MSSVNLLTDDHSAVLQTVLSDINSLNLHKFVKPLADEGTATDVPGVVLEDWINDVLGKELEDNPG